MWTDGPLQIFSKLVKIGADLEILETCQAGQTKISGICRILCTALTTSQLEAFEELYEGNKLNEARHL